MLESKKEEFFDEILQKYSEELQRHIYSIVLDHYYTKDIFQDTMAKAWTKFDQLNNIKNVRGWLFSIARNSAFDYQRGIQKRLKYTLSIDEIDNNAGTNADVLEEIIKNYNREMVLQSFMKLKKEDRELISMRFITQMSLSEIAEVLNISEGTVSTRLTRVKKKCRVLFDEIQERENDEIREMG